MGRYQYYYKRNNSSVWEISKIWGYDTHHALVCTKYENSWSKTYRAIIDVKGNIVRGTESYYKIYPFMEQNPIVF